MGNWRTDPAQSAMLLIDVQEKLLPVIHQQDQLLQRLKLTTAAAQLLSVPLYITEQVPDKLGPTVPALLENSAVRQKISKNTFSSATVLDEAAGIEHWVVCGIETHICVRQTVLDLVEAGKLVTLLADAVSSRHLTDHETALADFRHAGIRVVTVESLLFEWMGSSEHPHFRDISRLVRES